MNKYNEIAILVKYNMLLFCMGSLMLWISSKI
jgi:hypothetical protein